jgi:phage terminase large subunit
MPKLKATTKTEFAWDPGEANPKQKQFYLSRTLYTAYGGARGGGKTHAVRTKAGMGAFTYPGIQILIMRRTYPELQSNHIEPMLRMLPQELVAYNGSLHKLYFYNGSVITFGHWSGVESELEYQGQEFDWIFIDEATQFTEREFRYLGGCLRGVRGIQIPKRMYLTCNPGGVGHRWVKRLFIDRDFKKNPENPEADEKPEDYSFIFATVEDNTHLLESSPSYLQQLSSLPENLRRAHRYGDWDAISGAYFPEFRAGLHTCQPFKIPAHWERYRAFDYGLDCLACYWVAVDETGRSYVYRGVKQSGLIVQDAAKLITDMTPDNEGINITFAPPDMWSRQKDTGKTMAEIFMTNGVPIIPVNNNRVQGHMLIKEQLAVQEDGKPGLIIFDTCKELIQDLQDIQADEKNPNDCAKEPHEITHTVDALRYYCISRQAPAASNNASQDWDEEDEDEPEESYETYMCGGEASADYIGIGA